MPSSMTHTYFGLDVYKCLNKNCQNKIKNSMEYFKLFCQGSDPFMFYHFLIGNKAKRMADIQKRMHHYHTQDFFLATINYIHTNKLVNNSDVMSYLYGYICHYCLDLMTHPYIYYKGGLYKRNDKFSYKYNGIHQEIEYGIDCYLISKKTGIKPSKFRVYKEIFDVRDFSYELKGIIDNTVGKVYKVDGASDIYKKSIWYMVNFFRLANYDPYGIKLAIYKLIDRVTPSSVINIKELSFSYRVNDINRYLNIDNKVWYCPWDKSKKYNSSFFELYELAKKMSIGLIEEVGDMLERDCFSDKRLRVLFNNLSFATGISCDEEVQLKYFEF